MTTILNFDASRCRGAHPPQDGLEISSAQVLMFTGVRREALHSGNAKYEPRQHEPMFTDPAPEKPSGKKRTRSKSG